MKNGIRVNERTDYIGSAGEIALHPIYFSKKVIWY
jgi:hypothetical protein